MAANIDTTIQAIIAQGEGAAWHGHGKEIPMDGLPIGRQIARAFELSPGLGSAHYKADIKVHLSDGSVVDHPQACAIVREYDQRVHPGTPGAESFGLPQTREQLRAFVLGLKQAGIDLSEPRLSYMGFLDAGRRFVASVNLGPVEINGETHVRYANLTWGVDGTMGREVMYSIVRAVCMNTVAMSRGDARALADSVDSRAHADTGSRIRNTKNADKRWASACIDLGDMHAEFKGLKARLERYAATPVNEDDVAAIFERVCKRAGFKLDSKRTQNRIQEWTRLYLGSGWAGTANGLHQAFTDRDLLADSVQTGRGNREPADAILTSALFGSGATFRETAESVLREALDDGSLTATDAIPAEELLATV